jgi:hypothetical protein
LSHTLFIITEIFFCKLILEEVAKEVFGKELPENCQEDLALFALGECARGPDQFN